MFQIISKETGILLKSMPQMFAFVFNKYENIVVDRMRIHPCIRRAGLETYKIL